MAHTSSQTSDTPTMWTSTRVGQGNNASAATAGVIRIFNLHNAIPLLWKYDVVYIYSHTEKKPAFFIPFWVQFGIAIGKSAWYNERATRQYTTTKCCCHPAGHQAELGVLSFSLGYVLLSKNSSGLHPRAPPILRLVKLTLARGVLYSLIRCSWHLPCEPLCAAHTWSLR